MLKPTRTILALTAGSLVLGLVGAGTAVAADHPMPENPGSTAIVPADDEHGSDGLGRHEEEDEYGKRKHARGKVVSHGPLTVRSRPTTHSHKVGKLYPHEKVVIKCKTRGERVDGNNIWYLLKERDEKNGLNEDPMAGPVNQKASKYGDDNWVAARYVKNFGKVEYCRS